MEVHLLRCGIGQSRRLYRRHVEDVRVQLAVQAPSQNEEGS